MTQLKAYRVISDFLAIGAGVCSEDGLITDEELTHEYWIEWANFIGRSCPGEELGKAWREQKIAQHRVARDVQEAAADVFRPLRAGLPKLGCVIHPTEGVYLIVEGELRVENVKVRSGLEEFQGAWLFQRLVPYGSSADKVVHVFAWAEEAPLADVFEQVSEAPPLNLEPDLWGERATHSLLPRATEEMEEWARRVAVPSGEVQRLLKRLSGSDDYR